MHEYAGVFYSIYEHTIALKYYSDVVCSSVSHKLLIETKLPNERKNTLSSTWALWRSYPQQDSRIQHQHQKLYNSSDQPTH